MSLEQKDAKKHVTFNFFFLHFVTTVRLYSTCSPSIKIYKQSSGEELYACHRFNRTTEVQTPTVRQ